MSDNYDVGYGKPPQHTRFAKGTSGNPKGRPRGIRNFHTDLEEELSRPITVREGGRIKTISAQQALITRTVEKALQGDLRAIEMLVRWRTASDCTNADAASTLPLTADDMAIIDRCLAQRAAEGNQGNYGGNDA